MRSKRPQLGTTAWQVENQSRADTPELLQLKEVLTDQGAPWAFRERASMMAEPQASASAGHSPTSLAPIAACAASQLTGRDVAARGEGCCSS